MSLSPKYTFLSWYRQGMATYIEQADDPSQAGTNPVLTFGIELAEEAGQTEHITKAMPLVTPQNIVGIRPEAIIKTTPLSATLTHPANHVASVEFYDEDFPWRYTPAAPFNNKLRPWLWLMVLEEGEYTIVHHSNRPLAYVTLGSTLADGSNNPALQIPPDDAWAWAHVQVNQPLNNLTNGHLQDALKEALEQNPDVAFSRIISPRQLKANTRYRAFVVPYFEQGRLAGLGEDPSTANVLEAAWTANDLDSASKDFPFYHQWEFSTSPDGDFETLARKLAPQELNNVPLLTMNVEKALAHFQGDLSRNDGSKVVELESALMPVGVDATPWPEPTSTADEEVQSAITDQLNPIVDTTASTNVTNIGTANLSEDIVVNVPPVYGKWHLDGTAWQSLNGRLDHTNAGWIHQVNTDLRARALAGLGVQVVRKNQEEFMSEAWAQIGEVIEANRKINQTLLARETSYQLHKKLQNASKDTTIAITGSLHQRVLYDNGTASPASMKQEIKHSNLSKAPTDSAFTKLRRPSGKQVKKLKKQANNYVTNINPNQEFLTHINQLATEEINGAPDKPSPYQSIDNTTPNVLNVNIPSNEVANLQNHIGTIVDTALSAADLTTQEAAVQTATNPLFTINKRLLGQLEVTNTSTQEGVVMEQPSLDKIKPVMAAPEIQHPLYNYLKTVGQRFILPDLKAYGDNFVGLLNVNQEFIEKFMVGVNHEMGRELLWRGYPTDQRGTYFRQFWNVKDHIQVGLGQVPYKDIAPIHTWDKASSLGSHRSAGYPSTPLVLVLKGELIRANPDLVIYAHQAISNPALAATISTNKLTNVRAVKNPSTTFSKTLTSKVDKKDSLESKRIIDNPEERKKDAGDSLTSKKSMDIPLTSKLDMEASLKSEKVMDGPLKPRTSSSKSLTPNTSLSNTALSSTLATNLSLSATTGPKKILNPVENASTVKYPIFRAELAPDIVVLGFDIDVATAKGNATDAGWYFMLKERPGKIKLGMDEGATVPTQLNNFNDLHWQHMPVTADGISYIAPQQSLNFASGALPLANSAAELATHLYQAPLMLGIHAARLLP